MCSQCAIENAKKIPLARLVVRGDDEAILRGTLCPQPNCHILIFKKGNVMINKFTSGVQETIKHVAVGKSYYNNFSPTVRIISRDRNVNSFGPTIFNIKLNFCFFFLQNAEDVLKRVVIHPCPGTQRLSAGRPKVIASTAVPWAAKERSFFNKEFIAR